MNDEKWHDLKGTIKEKAREYKEYIEDASREDDLGHKVPTKKEVLEFEVELGEFKVERTTRPVILDKKTHYHKGAGGADVEFVLSEDEFTHKVEIFKKDEYGEWQPLDIPTERLSF